MTSGPGTVQLPSGFLQKMTNTQPFLRGFRAASGRLPECEPLAVQRGSHSDLLPPRGQRSCSGEGAASAPRPSPRPAPPRPALTTPLCLRPFSRPAPSSAPPTQLCAPPLTTRPAHAAAPRPSSRAPPMTTRASGRRESGRQCAISASLGAGAAAPHGWVGSRRR